MTWNRLAAMIVAASAACAAAQEARTFEQLVESAGRVDRPQALDAAAEAALGRRVSDEAVAARKLIVLKATAADPSFNARKKNSKYQNAIAAAKLTLDPNDKAMVDWLAGPAEFDDSFGFSGMAGVLARFGDAWSPQVRDALVDKAVESKGFLGGGTENMVAMWRSAGLLIGERFPDRQFRYGLTGRELAAECKKFIQVYGHAVYGGSMVEYLSPIYLATNSAAWINLAAGAKDEEARLMAEAVLDWMAADLALNDLEGTVTPPLQREKGLLTGTYQRSWAVSNTQWVSWMWFGGGNTGAGGAFGEGREPYKPPPALHAMWGWTPSEVIRNIAAKRVDMPYSVMQSRANWEWVEKAMTNAYGKKGADATGTAADNRAQFRSVYMNRDYALGAGYFKTNTADPTMHTIVPFGVTWKTADETNMVLVTHPYWYADMHGEDGEPPLGDGDRLGVSPFARTVQWENAAVIIYNIPPTDPYASIKEKGDRKFKSERNEFLHTSVYINIPVGADEVVNDRGFYFAREGKVYVSFRPLTRGMHPVDSPDGGYTRIELPGPLTGLAIEVGDEDEYGSFDRFRDAVLHTKADPGLLASEKRVEYTTTRGHTLAVGFADGAWLPDASVDGAKLDYERWPICRSPYVNCEDRVLDINDGKAGFTIDWRGELPIYTYYNIVGGKRVETHRRFIRDGKIIIEKH